jgi:hypothetical protein
MNPEWQAAINGFREAAARFVKDVDCSDGISAEQFLKRVEICLTELHATALRLPIAAPETDRGDTQPISIDTRAALEGQLRKKFGKSDRYWSVFDATEKAPPVDGSLAGDISEIYMDLKESLREIDQHPLDADILWGLRFSFTSHWGRHLTSALKAIFDLQSNGTLG